MKLTTKKPYHNGYNTARDNKPRTECPHRPKTESERIWLAGFDAYVAGGETPEMPRKKRTKAEMAKAKSAKLPRSLRCKKNTIYTPTVNRSHDPLLMDNIYAKKDAIAAESDPELLETLHMELADLDWLASMADGEKPSTIWGDYKRKHGLTFERKAA